VAQAAFRLARAATGKRIILKFEGHYHGWFDNILWSTAPAENAAGPEDAPVLVAGSRGQDRIDAAGAWRAVRSEVDNAGRRHGEAILFTKLHVGGNRAVSGTHTGATPRRATDNGGDDPSRRDRADSRTTHEIERPVRCYSRRTRRGDLGVSGETSVAGVPFLAVADGEAWPRMVDQVTVPAGLETALGAALGEELDSAADTTASNTTGAGP